MSLTFIEQLEPMDVPRTARYENRNLDQRDAYPAAFNVFRDARRYPTGRTGAVGKQLLVERKTSHLICCPVDAEFLQFLLLSSRSFVGACAGFAGICGRGSTESASASAADTHSQPMVLISCAPFSLQPLCTHFHSIQLPEPAIR